MSARSALRRGFTLLEVMTAVVIVIILASLAVSYMMYGMGKARMNNAVFDVMAMISGAQLSAVSRGTPHFVFVYQTPDNRVRIQLLERPDDDPPIADAAWNTLDLTNGPDVALTYNHTQPSGVIVTRAAIIRDQLALGMSSGSSGSGLAFLHLSSNRITKPLPAPFGAVSMSTSAALPPNVDMPTQDLLAGCNFCVSPNGQPYGVLRFNPDGTMDVLTGQFAKSGALLSFAPNTDDEKGFTPKLLAVSAPAGAAVVF